MRTAYINDFTKISICKFGENANKRKEQDDNPICRRCIREFRTDKARKIHRALFKNIEKTSYQTMEIVMPVTTGRRRNSGKIRWSLLIFACTKITIVSHCTVYRHNYLISVLNNQHGTSAHIVISVNLYNIRSLFMLIINTDVDSQRKGVDRIFNNLNEHLLIDKDAGGLPKCSKGTVRVTE